MMSQDEAAELVKKYGGIRQAARAKKIPYSRIHRALNSYVTTRNKPGDSASVSHINVPNKKSIKDFRRLHDKAYIIPKRIKAGLESLGSGWEYESKFAKDIGVHVGDLATYRDMFSEHIVHIKQGRRLWAGRKAVAEEMRKML